MTLPVLTGPGQQLWPPLSSTEPMPRQVWNARTARRVPGVGRALAIYGLIASMPMDAYRGANPLPRPRLLDQPDPTEDGGPPLFIRDHVTDYLLHGNAVHLVTATDQYGYPLAVRYVPAELVGITCNPLGGDKRIWIGGQEVPLHQVIHVRRGTDPYCPARGIGVIEEYLGTFDRAAKQEQYENDGLTNGAVPSAAIIAPQRNLTQDQADEAGAMWQQMFSSRMPGIFPNGTEVKPLSWSPSDQQLTEARQLTLTDVANAFNLDNYWLGAPSSSHTYKSAGPLFDSLNRISLLPVYTDLSEVWGRRWLPRGQRIRFDQKAITADDLANTIPWLVQAVNNGLWSVSEGRTYMGMDPNNPDLERVPVPAHAAPPAPPADGGQDGQGSSDGGSAA